MDEFDIITIEDGQGVEKDVELIFSYTDEETARTYYLYADNTDDQNKEVNSYVFYRDPDSPENELYAIETDEEYDRIIEVFDTAFNSIEQVD